PTGPEGSGPPRLARPAPRRQLPQRAADGIPSMPRAQHRPAHAEAGETAQEVVTERNAPDVGQELGQVADRRPQPGAEPTGENEGGRVRQRVSGHLPLHRAPISTTDALPTLASVCQQQPTPPPAPDAPTPPASQPPTP